MSQLSTTDRETLRETWEFPYSPQALKEASEKRLEYHQQRLEWWENEREEAEGKLKDKGFEYREQQRSTLAKELVVVADPDLLKRVKECSDKVTQHERRIREYEAWIRAFTVKMEKEPGTDIPLKIKDILHFGL